MTCTCTTVTCHDLHLYHSYLPCTACAHEARHKDKILRFLLRCNFDFSGASFQQREPYPSSLDILPSLKLGLKYILSTLKSELFALCPLFVREVLAGHKLGEGYGSLFGGVCVVGEVCVGGGVGYRVSSCGRF
ncbi:hypothetical protein RRG08_061587 [Elysia crispata]|uniref:Uncharacterized protein n=1 Tax=Elysia crispata TaxID=231223 RepID=A0AAE1D430_9GAST|nr:hypothetical protein RRG08_061587 [Elysia crispata]